MTPARVNSSTRAVIARVLRSTLYAASLVVVFLAALYVAARLRASVGQFVGPIMAIGFGAAWMATPESRAMAEKVIEAMRRTPGMSRKAAALSADMPEAQLSRQLGQEEQMSLSRYARWWKDFPEFWPNLSIQLLKDSGYTVIQNSVLVSILDELRAERKEGVA